MSRFNPNKIPDNSTFAQVFRHYVTPNPDNPYWSLNRKHARMFEDAVLDWGGVIPIDELLTSEAAMIQMVSVSDTRQNGGCAFELKNAIIYRNVRAHKTHGERWITWLNAGEEGAPLPEPHRLSRSLQMFLANWGQQVADAQGDAVKQGVSFTAGDFPQGAWHPFVPGPARIVPKAKGKS